MNKIVIHGARLLSGNVTVSGAKNSIVALMPASILADEVVILEGVPEISDVYALINILQIMGAKIHFTKGVLTIDPRGVKSIPMPSGKINSLRASYYFMGALLGKFGKATVGLPGGCNLGPRPIDLHIKGFEALGAVVFSDKDVMYLRTKKTKLVASHIFMDIVSVGATINIMLAAVKAKGRTIIENAAREPEIIDVATLLNNMGAKVYGAGTNEIRIDGVSKLHGTKHFIIPDRIEAGTYLAIAAAVGRGVTVHNVLYEHLESYISKLEEMGVQMTIREDSITVHPNCDLKMINVKTYPYPGFATDLQQPITPLLLKSYGQGELIDTIYERRIGHISELKRMGANINIDGYRIIMDSPSELKGAEVVASDLRAGASLIVAGLIAKGVTTIYNVEFILRGYDRIIEKLTNLGADIALVDTNNKVKLEERGGR
ncbi:MAG: UDP-N-acetylglucosamine 1-carboxyvinyltransferase [Streptococcaceae bacterium]|jgi:UDP-N-acetylglucosamine 1-carboxyvinyltransferase|nr:UDP-N-acetylglucosamine 1-carboxyvinyltransferase [Streptococcaceae bacterium]